MQLAQVLDAIEGLLVASNHPEIVKVERYGTSTEPWGPSVEQSRAKSISGVQVFYSSTATAMIWGATWPGEKPLAVPQQMPPFSDRAARLSIFVVQLLDAARPSAFRSWQLVALPDLGPSDQPGTWPAGVSIVCADGTKMLLRSSATGVTLGAEPEQDPFPDHRIPEGVQQWQQAGAAPAGQS